MYFGRRQSSRVRRKPSWLVRPWDGRRRVGCVEKAVEIVFFDNVRIDEGDDWHADAGKGFGL